MQLCWGGPRLRLPAVTDKQINQRENVRMGRYKAHVQLIEQRISDKQKRKFHLMQLWRRFWE